MLSATHKSGQIIVTRYMRLPTILLYNVHSLSSNWVAFSAISAFSGIEALTNFASSILFYFNNSIIRFSFLKETDRLLVQSISMPRRCFGSSRSLKARSLFKFYLTLFICVRCLSNIKTSSTNHKTINPLSGRMYGALGNSFNAVPLYLFFNISCHT